MKLDDFVAVSGLPGVFKMVANRNNGLIIENLESGERKFVTNRKHQFTPLGTIGVYSTGEDDTVELKVVFRSMLEKLESDPPILPDSAPNELLTYFRKVMPDFDEDRVRINDIKKMLKWFAFLNKHDQLSLEEEEEKKDDQKEEEGKEKEGQTENKTEKEPDKEKSDVSSSADTSLADKGS